MAVDTFSPRVRVALVDDAVESVSDLSASAATIPLALTPCVMAQGLLITTCCRIFRLKTSKLAGNARARYATRRPNEPLRPSPSDVFSRISRRWSHEWRGRSDSGAAQCLVAIGDQQHPVTGAANVNAMQRFLEAHGRRVTRIGAGVRSNQAQEPTGVGTAFRGWVGPGRFYGGYGKHPEVYKRLAPPPSGQWAAPRGTARGHSAASERS